MLAVDAVDADRKHREGRTCPSLFVVEGTRQNQHSGECLQETNLSLILFSLGGLRRRYYDCRMSEDWAAIEANLALDGALSIAVSVPFPHILPCFNDV